MLECAKANLSYTLFFTPMVSIHFISVHYATIIPSESCSFIRVKIDLC